MLGENFKLLQLFLFKLPTTKNKIDFVENPFAINLTIFHSFLSVFLECYKQRNKFKRKKPS